MSGRLVILPKKSYCPWKTENVERVLRDERLDKERRDKEQERVKQEESRARIRALKKEPEREKDQQRHINLFEQEERAVNDQAVNGIKASSLEIQTLGEVTRVTPFYLQISSMSSSPMNGRDADISMKDRKRKAALDPMHTFASESSTYVDVGRRRCDSLDLEPSTGARRQRRHEKKKRKSKDSATRSTVEELRWRRKEREEIEVRRAASLTRTEQDGRSNGYQNQYNPHLSRK